MVISLRDDFNNLEYPNFDNIFKKNIIPFNEAEEVEYFIDLHKKITDKKH